MKDEDIIALIKYRLERARESLEEAKLLFDQKHTNTYVNRLYYACFYAVSALLLKKGLSSSKHSGVRSLFHKHFVKTGLLDHKQGQQYDKLFDNRQKGDYVDLIYFDADDIRDWHEEAQQFVDIIRDMINI